MTLKISFLDAGYCTHPECITLRGGRFSSKVYPAMFIHIEHPKFGHILYDTGYSKKFKEVTSSYPNKLYALITPVYVNDNECALEKMKSRGVNPEDISYIILSHFHADHIGGINDFPKAKFIYLKSDYENIKHLKGFRALLNGFIPELIPRDFEQRSIKIDEKYRTKNYNSKIESLFEYSYDLFQDGSVIAVDLPGHTSSQMGLYLRGEDKEYLLVADSCWLSKSIRENKGPSFISKLIVHNSKEYHKTLSKLHLLYKSNPEIEQIPSHCGEKFMKLVEDCHFEKINLNGL